MLVLYIFTPKIIIINPIIYKNTVFKSNYYHLYTPCTFPTVAVTAIPIIQTTIVLIKTRSGLKVAPIYFVTVTPFAFKNAIEIIPKGTAACNTWFWPIYLKYFSGL